MVQKTPTSLDNFFVMCNSDEKLSQLVQFLKTHPNDKVIVFFMTCACVDFFVKALPLCGVPAESVMGLHGRMQQKKRVSTHHKFKQVHMCCSAPPRSPFALVRAPLTWLPRCLSVVVCAEQACHTAMHRCGRPWH